MNDQMKKSRFFQDACTRCGLKITPQRMVIFEELSKAKDHPSADELYKRVRKILPHISFDTVYRTLLSFSETGMARLVEGYGEVRRFDPDLEDHHHLHCLRCQKIIDFCDKSYAALKIPSALEQEFEVIHKRVVFEGLCRDCRNKK